jgi:hypothetical protein
MHHQRVRKVDARTRVITTVAGSGRWGHTGDGGQATAASLAGPAGIAIVPGRTGLTLYIADYYNGHVRAVTPDGIIRDVGAPERVSFGAPTRVAYAPRPARPWDNLWIADSSVDHLVALPLRREQPPALTRQMPVPALKPRPGPTQSTPAKRVGG